MKIWHKKIIKRKKPKTSFFGRKKIKYWYKPMSKTLMEDLKEV